MQLCLIHNDPFETLLATPDGEPLYSIHTPSKADAAPDVCSSSPPSFELHPRFTSPNSNSSSSSSSDSSTFSGVTSASNSSTSTTPISSTEFMPTKSPPSPPLPARALRDSFASMSASSGASVRPHHPTITAGNQSPLPICRTHSHPNSHHHRDSSSPRALPHIAHQSIPLPTPDRPAWADPGPVTSVHRLERPHYSRGNAETEVGRIEYCGEHIGTRVQLCHTGMELFAPACSRSRTPASSSANVSHSQQLLPRRNDMRSDANTALAAFQDFANRSNQAQQKEQPNEEKEFLPKPVWEFKGPDNRSYKWMTLANCPFLVHNISPTPTPIARYRPAKLGIVTRSRKAFLEIMPSGLNLEDMIVVTFVGYFRMWLGNTAGRTHRALPATITPTSTPTSHVESSQPIAVSIAARPSPSPLHLHHQHVLSRKGSTPLIDASRHSWLPIA